MRCGACSSNALTIAGFATSTTWNSISSRSGVASSFDQNIIDRAVRQWHVQLRVCTCPCKRRPLWAQTVTDVFLYELLRRLFHIGNFCFWLPFLKQPLLRNYAVDFVEICNVYVGKVIIKAAKRIFNSDEICRSYTDLNFGVTFFWNTVYIADCRIHFYLVRGLANQTQVGCDPAAELPPADSSFGKIKQKHNIRNNKV